MFSIASAGDMAFSLLALGADDVVAVDVDPAQLRLADLKRAAVLSLPREETIRFLGLLPASTADRRRWLAAVVDRLPPEGNAFWRVWFGAALRGAVAEGQYERYMRACRALVRPAFGRSFRQLVECSTLDQQRVVFDRSFDRPVLKALFRLAFHPRLYGRHGLDPLALRHHAPKASLGLAYFERFRALCLDSPACANPFLQWHLLGRVLDVDVVPEYLTARGSRIVRTGTAAISFAGGSALDYLAASPQGRFDRFHLSNLPDWLSARDFNRLLELVVEKARRPARVVWRYLHRRPLIPDHLRAMIQVDPRLAMELQHRDRFPIYSIVPAEIRA